MDGFGAKGSAASSIQVKGGNTRSSSPSSTESSQSAVAMGNGGSPTVAQQARLAGKQDATANRLSSSAEADGAGVTVDWAKAFKAKVLSSLATKQDVGGAAYSPYDSQDSSATEGWGVFPVVAEEDPNSPEGLPDEFDYCAGVTQV